MRFHERITSSAKGGDRLERVRTTVAVLGPRTSAAHEGEVWDCVIACVRFSGDRIRFERMSPGRGGGRAEPFAAADRRGMIRFWDL
jgi:hypothetical protein